MRKEIKLVEEAFPVRDDFDPELDSPFISMSEIAQSIPVKERIERFLAWRQSLKGSH